MLICGIDEAGRGAVLGPLVVAGVCFHEDEIKKLGEMGVTDSKLLTPKKREELEKEISRLSRGSKLIKISPETIDAREGQAKNLNTLEVEAFKSIVEALKPEVCYVDSVLRNPEKLKAELKSVTGGKLIVEHKADKNYTVVGAASILAKVTRDAEIRAIEAKFRVKIGSGYPADPDTIRFLEENIAKNYPFVRKTWAPFKEIKARAEQRKLF